MSLATYKTMEFIMFFGLVFVFGFWQLGALRRMRRNAEQTQPRETPAREPDARG